MLGHLLNISVRPSLLRLHLNSIFSSVVLSYHFEHHLALHVQIFSILCPLPFKRTYCCLSVDIESSWYNELLSERRVTEDRIGNFVC